MKKIIFYAVCIFFLAGTGCNNNDEKSKGNESKSDSSKIVEKTDSTSKKIRTARGVRPTAINADLTAGQRLRYIEFKKTTQKVKFNYTVFNEFIKSMDKRVNVEADDIYLVYGAYTDEDTKRYLTEHRTTGPVTYDEIYNQPCLLEGYLDPSTSEFNYKDFGSLCPPPYSCSSEFRVTNIKEFVENKQANFDSKLTIANFNQQYDKASSLNLTAMVKFNIMDIKAVYDSLDKVYPANNTTDIYFSLGAYTQADANRYVTIHKGPSASQIRSKTCLLLAYYVRKDDKFLYFDFGVLCPLTNK